jgi:hypothetical protein
MAEPFRWRWLRGYVWGLSKFCLSAEQLGATALNFGEIVCDHVVDPAIRRR